MKKSIKITGMIAASAILLINVYLMNQKSINGKLNLASLISLNDANAECINTDRTWMWPGRCSAITGNCYNNFQDADCDYTMINNW